LDPRNGDVLALVSSPAFDPNQLAASLSSNEWNAIRSDTNNPLLNRATAGTYAPGSLFKTVVAVAALEKGISPSTPFNCPGYFALGGSVRLKCWNTSGHGLVPNVPTAIEQSCNTYFCSLGSKCGYAEIRRRASELGMGRKSGLEIDVEDEDRLPDVKSVDHPGDLANVSVGQGAVAATPLQMAVVAGAIAMRGHVCRPRLVLGYRAPGEESYVKVDPSPLKDLHWSPSTANAVRDGMRRVIHEPSGTGKRAKVDDELIMGGKTGTAEFGTEADDRVKWGWMMVFAPYDDPRYAVAMVIEHAESGGRTVAPCMMRVMAGIFEKKLAEQ